MKRINIAFLCVVFLLSLIISPLCAADNVFKENGYGYTLNYPENWTYVKKSPYVIVFTKKTGTDVNAPVVGVQNLLSTKVTGGKYENMDAVIKDFENQLKITKQAKVYPAETYVYDKNGVKITGKQFMAEYVFKNNNYKQLIIVIPRKNGEMFHVWVYSATAGVYDKNIATFKAMFDSWMIKE